MPETTRHKSHPQSHQVRALMKRDGTLNVHRTHNREILFSDLYHYFFSISWPKFFLHIAAIYLLMNLFFAGMYFSLGVDALGEGHAAGLERFKHCFFLSVETMIAVEYSRMVSGGFIAHILMTIQAFSGLLTLAVTTGLVYARFSRPTARVIFSNKAIIGIHNGRPCFSFRVANERLNQIVEARTTLTLTKNEVSREGESSRKFYDLKLERDYSPLFALSWTVRHFINENSPLFGMDHNKMRADQVAILASLTGIDDTFNQPITARNAYTADEIVFNKRFKDIILWHESRVQIDLKGINDIHDLTGEESTGFFTSVGQT